VTCIIHPEIHTSHKRPSTPYTTCMSSVRTQHQELNTPSWAQFIVMPCDYRPQGVGEEAAQGVAEVWRASTATVRVSTGMSAPTKVSAYVSSCCGRIDIRSVHNLCLHRSSSAGVCTRQLWGTTVAIPTAIPAAITPGQSTSPNGRSILDVHTCHIWSIVALLLGVDLDCTWLRRHPGPAFFVSDHIRIPAA
jgi:hypothetical protein